MEPWEELAASEEIQGAATVGMAKVLSRCEGAWGEVGRKGQVVVERLSVG